MKLNKGLFTSDRGDWATPPNFFDKLDAEFHFTLDVCASPNNNKCKRFLTKEQNGLIQDWARIAAQGGTGRHRAAQGGTWCLLYESTLWVRNPRLGKEGKRKRMPGSRASSGQNRHTLVSQLCLRQSGDSIRKRTHSFCRG